MTVFQSLILGIVQGLTEFFPVSSSAHLRIAKWLMGIPDGEHLLNFDLFCHSGTLIALILYLRKEIFAVLSDLRAIGLFATALLPLIPAYFLLKPFRIAASDPAYLGYFMMFTAFLLFIASKKQQIGLLRQAEFARVQKMEADRELEERIKYRDVLCIGMMQTMALLPGISRSGSTIATARLLGWDWIAAARFSFLLAIPAILGGQALETLKLIYGHEENVRAIPTACYAAGFCASFAFGMIGVRFIFWIYEKGNVRPFAWYCLGMGILTAWTLHG